MTGSKKEEPPHLQKKKKNSWKITFLLFCLLDELPQSSYTHIDAILCQVEGHATENDTSLLLSPYQTDKFLSATVKNISGGINKNC